MGFGPQPLGSTSGQGIEYGYDGAKRLGTETSYGRALSFLYDLNGNRTRITYPDGNYIVYEYDGLDRMTFLRENGAGSGVGVLAQYQYDTLSRRDFLTRGNGTTSDYGYDPASRLQTLAHNLGGTTHDATFGFGYTLASQLQTRSTTNSALGWWTAPQNEHSYAVNGRNQYTSVNGTTYSYTDGRGNLNSDGARTFVYDVENRLLSVSGSASMTLTYDPLGRLRQTVAGSTTTQFLYDGDRLVAEYNDTNILQRRYVHGAGVDEPIVWYETAALTDRRWLHADERGSVIAHTDGGGAATAYNYGPYGEQPTWVGSRFRYTSQIMLPEVQLYHYKARVYDPAIGRFLQTDPIGYDDDFNLYAYTGNDPINFADQTGKGKKWVGWLVQLSGKQMKHVAQVTKEQAVRLRRQGENFKGRTYQKAQEVEKAAHGEQNLIRHSAHDEGFRPHFQTAGKPGHSFWSIAAVATTLAASALDSTAEAASAVGETLEGSAEAASDVAGALDPMGWLKSGHMEPPPGFRQGAFGTWIKEAAQAEDAAGEQKEKTLVTCTGSRIARESC